MLNLLSSVFKIATMHACLAFTAQNKKAQVIVNPISNKSLSKASKGEEQGSNLDKDKYISY